MTKAEKYDMLRGIVEGMEMEDEDIKAELIQMLKEDAAAVKARNVRNKGYRLQKKAERAVITDRIYAVLSDWPQTIPEIVDALDDEAITAAMVVPRLTRFIEEGKVVKTMGKDEDGHKVAIYTLTPEGMAD